MRVGTTWRALLIGLVVAAGCSSSEGTAESSGSEEVPTTSTTVAATDESTTTTTTTTTTSPTTTTTVVDEALVELRESSLASTLDGVLGSADGGIAMLWRQDGVVTRAAVGVADASGAEMEPEQPLRVGSITKPLVATMVVQLRDEGAIDLDSPLAAYVPEQAPNETVTVRELLSHRSGVASYTDQPAYVSDAFGDLSRSFSTSELLAYIDGAAGTEPGTFAYSNTNYILLGLLVEQIDGVPLADALARRITGPLGMADTSLATTAEPSPGGLGGGWSPSAGLTGDPAAEYTAMASSSWAAGALVSTTDDLAVFLDALFGGSLVSEASLAEMTDVGLDGYGLGLFSARLDPAQPAFGHNGLIPGFSATMAFEPGSNDLLVVITNNDAVNADLVAQQVLAG